MSARPDSANILTYNAGWATNGISWSRTAPGRLGVSSFISDYSNTIAIVQRDSDVNGLVRLGTLNHYYPPTKLLYSPAAPGAGVDDGRSTDSLVTSGDYLRLWTLTEGAPAPAGSNAAGSHPDQAKEEDEQEKDGADAEDAAAAGSSGDAAAAAKKAAGPKDSDKLSVTPALAHTFKHSPRPNVSEDFCAPVTSFDWNAEDPKLVAASSIDTTVSLWDLNTKDVTVHLIAHDKEVFDVAFQPKSTHVFATCGADGNIRVFDIRRMDHCTVVYENPKTTMPMLRVEWNRQDPNHLAAITAESSEVVVFDFRYPANSEAHLRGGHDGPLNSFAWAPHTASNLCTAGEDGRAIIWDTEKAARTDPAGASGLTYESGSPLNSVAWSTQEPDWIAVSFDEKLQMLHV